MSNHVGSDSDFRDGFLEGAARAFFVMAYADFVENESDGTLPQPKGGQDWYDFAPATPPNAYALAGALWAVLGAATGEAGVYTLRERAMKADGRAPDAEEFGRDFAMMHMGTGVSWFDNHAKFEVRVPQAEIGAHSFSEESYRAK